VARGLHFSNRWCKLTAGLLTPLNDAYNSSCGMTGDSVSGGNTYKNGLMTPTLRLYRPLFSAENTGGTSRKIIDKETRISPRNA
jgi:hypothetical protein